MLAAFVSAVLLLIAATADAASWALVLGEDASLAGFKGVEANFKDGLGRYRIVFKKRIFNKKHEQKCVPVANIVNSAGEIGVIASSDPANRARWRFGRSTAPARRRI